jgi:hypothetical protein
MGVVLPTARLSDLIWDQAVVQLSGPALARNWWQDNTMSNTSRMLEQSRRVDEMVAREQLEKGDGLIADVGKDWVTTHLLWQPPIQSPNCEKGPVRSANYGGHTISTGPYLSATFPGVFVIQPVGLCHGMGHTDYSQVVRLVRRDVLVCGPGLGSGSGTDCEVMDIRSIVNDPRISGLVVEGGGTLPAMRHPAVDPSCQNRCPDTVSTMEADVPPDKPGGAISCPAGCSQLPPPGVDPTWSMPPQVSAGMGALGKLLFFGVGSVVGYYAFTRLAPSPRGSGVGKQWG